MTLPYERKAAIDNTRRFLIDLCNPKETPRIPQSVRERARSLLRHYPGKYYMQEIAEELPHIFGKNDE